MLIKSNLKVETGDIEINPTNKIYSTGDLNFQLGNNSGAKFSLKNSFGNELLSVSGTGTTAINGLGLISNQTAFITLKGKDGIGTDAFTFTHIADKLSITNNVTNSNITLGSSGGINDLSYFDGSANHTLLHTGNISSSISNSYLRLIGGTMIGNITFDSNANIGILNGDNTQRLLLGGGSAWSGTSGAYIALQGIDYGGTGLGGNIVFQVPAGKDLFVGTGKVWHEGNDGAGSELDADHLDGYTWSGVGTPLTLTNFVSTANSERFRIQPTDFGVGNPYFLIKKTLTPDIYNIGLWDGVNSNGTIRMAVGNVEIANSLNIKGITTAENDIVILDNDRLILGTNYDFRLYHDGVNSQNYIYSSNGDWRFYDGVEQTTRFTIVRSSGNFTAGNIGTLIGDNPRLVLTEVDYGENWILVADNGTFSIRQTDTGSQRFSVGTDGALYAGSPSSSTEIWHAGNDGHESGLDADTVDGKELLNILAEKGEVPDNTSVKNANFETGIYRVNTVTSNPTGDGVQAVDVPEGGAAFATLVNFKNSSDTFFRIYKNYQSNGMWVMSGNNSGSYPRVWQKIWFEGNDGPGSGLNADLLDGVEGSSFLRSDAADTASELITFQKGISQDGNAKFYNWRALQNTLSSTNQYYRIARITGSQSSRFSIQLAGRSSLYSDTFLPAMGYIVGQLSSDNNYDIVFYNHSTEFSKVVLEVGQVDVDTVSTDIYIKVGTFAEISATGHISDGTITPYDSDSGSVNVPDPSYAAVTEYEVWNSGNHGSGSGLDADKVDGYEATQLARLASGNNFTAQQTISGVAQGLNLRGTGLRGDNTVSSYLMGQDSAGTNSWYIGMVSSSNNDLTIYNYDGDGYLRILDDNGGLIFSGNTVWHSGNASFYRSNIANTGGTGSIQLNDGYSFAVGTSYDMTIRHSGGNNLIDLLSGNLIIRDDTTDRVTIGRTTGNILTEGYLSAGTITTPVISGMSVTNANNIDDFIPEGNSLKIVSHFVGSENYSNIYGAALFVRGSSNGRTFAIDRANNVAGLNAGFYVSTDGGLTYHWEWDKIITEADIQVEENTTTGTIVLDNPLGRHYNMDSPSTASTFTIAANPVIAGTCTILINRSTEPVIRNPDLTNARKLAGSAEFIVSTDMYLVITWMGTNRKADYFFLEI